MVDNEIVERKTAQQILDVARDLVRSRGYSAFSYADISERVGIRKASIHYHFSSKDELVEKLVRQYRETMTRKCDRIARSAVSPDRQLMEFARLYQDGLEDGQICLCAMLAADFAVLPQPVQNEIHVFFQETETWLIAVLQQGCEEKNWPCHSSIAQEAKGIIAMLQGAQLLARSVEDSSAMFEHIVYPLLSAKFS